LRQSAYVSTTSKALSLALHRRYGGQPAVVIPNAFPLQGTPRTPGSFDPEGPSWIWFSQTIGPGRGLEGFLRDWARLRRPGRVTLLGDPRRGFPATLRAGVPESYRERIRFVPPVTPDALPAEIARHDIGLALEQREIPSRDATITNKILQYLNAGLAIVATPTEGQKEVMAEAEGAGILLDADRDRALQQLELLTSDDAGLAAHQRAARNAAENIYCWEKIAPRLLEQVARCLEGG
jgi:glycosyltransferase involved in cell wall biosynthesis